MSRTHPKPPKLRLQNAQHSSRKHSNNKRVRGHVPPSEEATRDVKTVRRAYAKADIAPAPIAGEIVESIPRVGRLQTVADWHRQVAKVYRAMRKGRLAKEDGTRLTYVANVGAQLAKYMDELQKLEDLARQLEEIKAERAGFPAIEHDAGDVIDASAEDPAP